MGWLITFAVLFALAVLPLGVRVNYNHSGLLVGLLVGPVKLTVYPLSQKEKKKAPKDKPKESAKAAEKQEEQNLPQPPQPPKLGKAEKSEKGGSLLDFLPLLKVALDFLGDFRRKLRLNHLYLRLIMASSDPCDLAVNYGKAWAAVGNLMPQLERLFVIKKRDVEVECDFTASETLIIARIDVSITLGRILALAAVYGIRAVKEFLTIQKKRKGGAVK